MVGSGSVLERGVNSMVKHLRGDWPNLLNDSPLFFEDSIHDDTVH